MTLFFNSSTASVLKESIITLTCVPVLLNFFAFTMLVLKNILQLLNKTHNLIVLLSAWLGEEHSDETFRRRVSKKLSLSAFFVMPKFLCQQKLFFLKFTLDFYWQVSLIKFIFWPPFSGGQQKETQKGIACYLMIRRRLCLYIIKRIQFTVSITSVSVATAGVVHNSESWLLFKIYLFY